MSMMSNRRLRIEIAISKRFARVLELEREIFLLFMGSINSWRLRANRKLSQKVALDGESAEAGGQPTRIRSLVDQERGDVPGWVLVVLMTAGLVTGIWTVAAPRLNLILRNSLDSMNSIR